MRERQYSAANKRFWSTCPEWFRELAEGALVTADAGVTPGLAVLFRLTRITILAVLVFLFISCGSDDSRTNNPGSPAENIIKCRWHGDFINTDYQLVYRIIRHDYTEMFWYIRPERRWFKSTVIKLRPPLSAEFLDKITECPAGMPKIAAEIIYFAPGGKISE